MYRILQLLLTAIFFIANVIDGKWLDPPCTRPNDPNIKNWTVDKLKYIEISFDEDIKQPITIADLHFDVGDRPIIIPSSDIFPLLGAEIRNNTLVVTKEQDYEVLKGAAYVFTLALQDSSNNPQIIVNIINLDDTPPVITNDQQQCVIKENYTGPTDCTFKISDVDSDVSKIEYTFINGSSPDINELFKFTLEPIKGTTSRTNAMISVMEGLNFDNTIFYYFTLQAKDPGNNIATSPILIKVKDINNKPPAWIKIPFVLSIKEEEKKDTVVNIMARDGDISINAPIVYSLGEFEYKQYFDIPNKTEGKLHIKRIDREKLKSDIINPIVVATETDEPPFNTSATFAVMVSDINDNPAVITPNEMETSILENTYTTLDFKHKIVINDIDEGPNAQYTVELIDNCTVAPKWIEAFQIVPTQGYQKWIFSVSVKNATFLDFDRTSYWRNMTMQIKSFDKVNIYTAMMKVHLINWNDEIPTFDKDIYSVKINETIKKNKIISTVHATDADYGDSVIHSIVGDAYKNLLEITKDTGIIQTMADNVFDYEKQRTVVIQVLAQDTLITDKSIDKIHKIYTQLTIEVLNIDDETPQIKLPRKSISVKENGTSDYIVANISAIDPDGNIAHLNFSIDWKNTIASKEGKIVDNPDEYTGTLEINTIYPDELNKGQAVGQIITTDKKIDFEKYEILSLSIKATDLNQKNLETVPNYDTATITIRIIDINDNAPCFDKGTIDSEKYVTEKSKTDFIIGTITAIDIDGPKFNRVKYYLKEMNGTLPNLVTINVENGEIKVEKNQAINADKQSNGLYTVDLYYTAYATDGLWNTTAEIVIHVVDTNDEVPMLSEPLHYNQNVKECTKLQEILQVPGTDNDRDILFHTITYYLNTLEHSELQGYYSVNAENGKVFINDTSLSKCGLSRDFGATKRTIYVLMKDNVGGQGISNSVQINFTITLTDINNQKPILPTKNIMSISENTDKDTYIDSITAKDKDEPNTNNTRIKYKITNIYRTVNSSKDPGPDLFRIETLNDTEGKIYTGKKLEGYYGSYIINVMSTDLGIPPQSDIKNYTIDITKYNFGYVTITYPKNNDILLLNITQTLNHALYTPEGELIKDFTADDHQNKKFFVNFEIIKPNSDVNNIFTTELIGPGISQLQLQKNFDKDQREYSLTIKAHHNGGGNSSAINQIKIYVIDPSLQPYFVKHTQQLHFLENCTNSTNVHDIYNGVDPNAITGINSLYYFIMHSDCDNFKLNKTSGELYLVKVLDREKVAFHNLIVTVTTHEYGPPENPKKNSLLNITIIVDDVNDNPPAFEKHNYEAGLVTSSPSGTEILTVKASDPDSSDDGKLVLKYMDETLTVSDDSLNDVKKQGNAFIVHSTGTILNNFIPQAEMKGYFTFKVEVIDTAGHTDVTSVKIYMISSASTVSFIFKNEIDCVNHNVDHIEHIFSTVLDYNCTVDHINSIADDKTEIQTHFLDENGNPVMKDVIIRKTTDYDTTNRLQTEFSKYQLHFTDIPQKPIVKDVEKLLKIILIVTSSVLAALCIILAIILIIKIKSLNRQLSAMKTNVFGSNSSYLNRIGINAPNTNKHAIEANPALHEELQYDNISQGSDKSDLIGIEDNPEFQKSSNDFEKNNEKPTKRKSINPLANGSTNNGFRF